MLRNSEPTLIGLQWFRIPVILARDLSSLVNKEVGFGVQWVGWVSKSVVLACPFKLVCRTIRCRCRLNKSHSTEKKRQVE